MSYSPPKSWGFPRIQVPGVLELIPGGRSGQDFKMIVNTFEPMYHHTISVGYPASGSMSLPVYIEKTLQTFPKCHKIIAEGSLDMGKVIEGLFPAALPSIRQVNLQQDYRGSEFILFTPEMLNVITSGTLNLTEGLLSKFIPVPIGEVSRHEFAFAAPVVDTTGSGLLIHTNTKDFSLTFPALNTIEDRMERVATLTNVEKYVGGYDEDYADDYW